MNEDEENLIAARDAVTRQIETAFDEVSRIRGVTLHEANAKYEGRRTSKRRAARRLDTETRWQDVPESDIERYHWILSHFNPVGFRYYMPAYMIWSLKNYADAEMKSVDYTVYNLLPYRSLYRWKMLRFKFLTRPQSESCCAFLRFMAEQTGGIVDDNAAREALEQYWGRFCPPDASGREREP